MNDMRTYNDRDYDNRYDNRYWDERYNNRYDYRDYDNRENYRDDYREDYRRDYDRRGGKINNRNYRNYRSGDFFEEIEMVMEDMREGYRKLEDISEMAPNAQDKNMLMKVAQKEKENYNYIKQMIEK